MKTIKSNWFTRFFPNNKKDWKNYSLKTLPIVIGEILFCVNGFLDNFMVSHIEYGIDSLTYANTWTGIIYSIFFAIQGIVAMFVGQYYGKKEYEKVNQIMNIRIWMYLMIVLSFALPIWINPSTMVYLVSGKNISTTALYQANTYLILITISWLITTYNFNTNMLLNETGHSNYAFVGATLTLFTNATINAICLYVFKKPAYFAAIGSIVSAIVCLISDSLFTFFKDRKIFVSPLKLFKISKSIAKQILKRIPAMLLTIVAMITIPIRMILWAHAYPEASIGKKWMAISGVTILGLVESLASVASAVTSACSSNVSYFVASELGNGNFEEAEKHSRALKGFHALSGILLSIIMTGVVYGIIAVDNTTAGIEKSVKNYFQDPNNLSNIKNEFQNLSSIVNVSNIPKDFIEARVQEAKQVFKDNFLKSCWTFIAFNPIWCIFYTTAALIRAGGRNYIGAIATLLSQGLAFVWLIVITLYFKPFFPQTFNLPLAYFVFFLFDFVRWGIFEIFQWKFDWKRNITHETISNIKNNL
ncbi:MATE family efflux transporter [Metamycoplasma buccale]|uniref:MATE family efflux transporter n=1 Tax=Metamycoplasma buccale TaxID=55602 RepID=UPI00398EF2C1